MEDESPDDGTLPFPMWLAWVLEVECAECGAVIGKPCGESAGCSGCTPTVCENRPLERACREDLPPPPKAPPRTRQRMWWEE